jgi:hypothetical protein
MSVFTVQVLRFVFRWLVTRQDHLLVMVLGLVWLWWRSLRSAIQNMGIVTRIEVRPGALVWRKRTLWRETEHRWSPATVTEVYCQNLMIKIRRTTGVPLGAFAHYPLEHREWICEVLRAGIARATEAPERQDPALRDSA